MVGEDAPGIEGAENIRETDEVDVFCGFVSEGPPLPLRQAVPFFPLGMGRLQFARKL